jgi:hypothetical protein
MSIWKAKMNLDGKKECRRCHRMFIPKKPDDIYGPTCARKMVTVDVSALAHLDGTDGGPL